MTTRNIQTQCGLCHYYRQKNSKHNGYIPMRFVTIGKYIDEQEVYIVKYENFRLGGEQNQVVHAGSVGCFIRVQRVLTLSS